MKLAMMHVSLAEAPQAPLQRFALRNWVTMFVLIERNEFPRPHLGESLTIGCLSIFDVLGLRECILQNGFIAPCEKLIRWAEDSIERLARDRAGNGLLVDRGSFDARLLQAAATSGVRVFQPARICGLVHCDLGWRIEVATHDQSHVVRAGFLVDASGRGGFLRARRERVTPRTVALCGYLQRWDSPPATLVEALCDGWCWGAPIPGGLYSVMVFLDGGALGSVQRKTIEGIWRAQLGSGLLIDPEDDCSPDAYC